MWSRARATATDRLVVRHAHGYGIQTLADLGLIGVGLSLLAAAAWLAAAIRATGLRPRDRGLPFDPERIGLLTLATVVIIFALHSLIDWTWFVPGNAMVALLCAGWVAGRPALRDRDAEVAAVPAPGAAPGASACAARRGSAPPPPRPCWSPRSRRAGRRSSRCAPPTPPTARRTPPSSASTTSRPAARETAADRNPLSLEPLWLLAFIEDAKGDTKAAHGYLEEAVQRQPANTEAWQRLGRYRLTVLGDAEGAVRAFRAAYFLDPAALETASDLIEATRVLRAKK